MSRFTLLDRLRGSVLAGSVGTSASEDKLLSSRESHPGVIPDYPGLSRIKTFDRAQRIMFRGKENGSGGTDHGHGSCLFVLGNQVQGGVVHGGIESLDQDLLYEGRDLPVRVDFRSVFSELAGAHLGVDAGESLFPGWPGPALPLLRPMP